MSFARVTRALHPPAVVLSRAVIRVPWDEWGRMHTSYQGKTGPDYDALIDTISAVCASDDHGAIADLYAREDLAVPAELLP
ncbi:hypothetical protein ACGFH8_17725 [Micromonospora sp. NPDC049175]|uniref:hypothetical protein n=1 Tax=Micromonospora sp. NPDC049175 TaxID=3364266 RepID=UPI003719C0E0